MKIERFIRESNLIEGELTALGKGRINPGDKLGIMFINNNGIKSIQDLICLHKIIGEYRNEAWVGRIRDINVYVGGEKCPEPNSLEKLLKDFFRDLPEMSAREAHNRFEKIHPFQDLNGRIGRLIWLYKMGGLKYLEKTKLSFLHKYYYQTLENYKNKIGR